jgi:SPP1 gp7 family putative phage head morphogenesis protein
MLLTHDDVANLKRETRAQKSHFAKVRNAEAEYSAKLRAVARQVQMLLRGFFKQGVPPSQHEAWVATQQLRSYAEILKPWATATARRMLADVSRRDAAAWAKVSRLISRALRREIETAPTGQLMQASLERQVSLITSLPLHAAQRVHETVISNLYTGTRNIAVSDPAKAMGLTAQILDAGDMTVGRANLIARTETARVAGELMEARARHVGSEGYIWHTVEDRAVRPRHRALNGSFHKWIEPPVASEPGQQEMRYHPGGGPNCRCFAEPVIPD